MREGRVVDQAHNVQKVDMKNYVWRNRDLKENRGGLRHFFVNMYNHYVGITPEPAQVDTSAVLV